MLYQNEKTTARMRLLTECVVVLSVILMLIHPVAGNSYRRYETSGIDYVRGTVLNVLSEELEESKAGTGQLLGLQTLSVQLQGGKTVEIENYLTETHNILTKTGQSVIVCADCPQNAAAYYTVYSYDRTVPLLTLCVLFLLILFAVGRRKGLDAGLAIVFTLLFILRVVLPWLYNGGSPILIGLLTVVLSTVITLCLLHGPTLHSLLGIVTVIFGEAAACVLFSGYSGILHLTGLQTDSGEGLLLIAQNTGLNVRQLLFAGVMIASLGAVMDVAVSVLSALHEVADAAVHPEKRALFHSGMRIGRDMIGTMSNTLIFAFVGGSLSTMLVFYSYGVHFLQLFNSDYMTVELAQGLCSTAAVILTVPLAAAIGAVFYARKAMKKTDKTSRLCK